jgi:hypothetical protein
MTRAGAKRSVRRAAIWTTCVRNGRHDQVTRRIGGAVPRRASGCPTAISRLRRERVPYGVRRRPCLCHRQHGPQRVPYPPQRVLYPPRRPGLGTRSNTSISRRDKPATGRGMMTWRRGVLLTAACVRTLIVTNRSCCCQNNTRHISHTRNCGSTTSSPDIADLLGERTRKLFRSCGGSRFAEICARFRFRQRSTLSKARKV